VTEPLPRKRTRITRPFGGKGTTFSVKLTKFFKKKYKKGGLRKQNRKKEGIVAPMAPKEKQIKTNKNRKKGRKRIILIET